MSEALCTIGVDLGGTKITAGLVSRAGEDMNILARDRRLLPVTDDDAKIIEAIKESIAAMMDAARARGTGVRSLGVGIPAIADGEAGKASSRCCPNLPLLERHDLARILENALRLPVGVANDANCFALGEARAGERRGVRDLVGITLGTGLGCGVVLGGQLHLGSRGRCGEIWDAPMPGGGILEDGLRGEDIARMAGQPSAREAAEAARQGDIQSLAAWSEFGCSLGLARAWIERLIDPEVFVLGGSLTKGWDLFSPAFGERGPTLPVICSKLGEDAALIGAACLVGD
jgi:glucokinase